MCGDSHNVIGLVFPMGEIISEESFSVWHFRRIKGLCLLQNVVKQPEKICDQAVSSDKCRNTEIKKPSSSDQKRKQ